MSEYLNKHQNLLLYRQSAYIVTASDIESVSRMIGDYQISTDLKTHTFNEHSTHCYSPSCKTQCRTSTPSFRRFLPSRHNKIKPDDLTVVIQFARASQAELHRHGTRAPIGAVDQRNPGINPPANAEAPFVPYRPSVKTRSTG
ncbi:uncharacterized protein isoform X2 [Rhodnius prolixus]|uniref:uncharacterized protein isoform X2 n=1 Tax=Rhodnius prolixus TaxID=13249 RepID=UPI003D18E5D8